jgi:hypothetical protein
VAKRKKSEPTVPGDVLGLTDDRTGVKLPHPPSDGTVPQGIEVRDEYKRHWGTEDLERGTGATGVDMGAGGKGTGIAPDRPRTKPAEEI